MIAIWMLADFPLKIVIIGVLLSFTPGLCSWGLQKFDGMLLTLHKLFDWEFTAWKSIFIELIASDIKKSYEINRILTNWLKRNCSEYDHTYCKLYPADRVALQMIKIQESYENSVILCAIDKPKKKQSLISKVLKLLLKSKKEIIRYTALTELLPLY